MATAKGYVRQENFADGDTVTADLFNNEYDQLATAFNSSTGHTHDGTTAEGSPITVLGPAQEIVVSGTKAEPKTTDAIDLGSTSLNFKTVHCTGITLSGGTNIISIDTDLSTVSASDDTLPSAKAVKTYVDSQVTAQDLDIAGDTGTDSIDLDSETLTYTGGTGIDTAVTTDTVTVSIDSTVATLTGSQPLTNKTLDADSNTISNLEVDNLKAGVLDTDISTTSDSDNTIPSAKAVKTYVDAQVDTVDSAAEISYSNTTSGLTATDTQAAIDEVESRVDTLETIDHIHSNKAVLDATTASFLIADETKLDGIEAGATADQTAPEIRTLVEAATDSNVFTDADHTKLNGIETGATGDQTGAEIKAAYEAESDTNAFTDVDHTKLDGIEAGADVTDTANVTAAGALMDSELTDIAAVKALDQGVATTDTPTFAGLTVDAGGVLSIGSNNASTVSDISLTGNAVIGGGSSINITTGTTGFFVRTGATDPSAGYSDGVKALKVADGGDISFYEDTGTTPKFFWDASAESLQVPDLIATGGVYLGGTGDANKLEDYEEGTWTPTFISSSTDPSVTYSTRSAVYRKVGSLVFVTFDMTISSYSGGSGSAQVGGFPFSQSGAARSVLFGRTISGVTTSNEIFIDLLSSKGFLTERGVGDMPLSDYSTSGFRIIYSGCYTTA